MKLIAGLFCVLLFAPAVLPETFAKHAPVAPHKGQKVKRHKGTKHKFGKAA